MACTARGPHVPTRLNQTVAIDVVAAGGAKIEGVCGQGVNHLFVALQAQSRLGECDGGGDKRGCKGRPGFCACAADGRCRPDIDTGCGQIDMGPAAGAAIDIAVSIDGRDGDDMGIGCRVGRLGPRACVAGSGNQHNTDVIEVPCHRLQQKVGWASKAEIDD